MPVLLLQELRSYVITAAMSVSFSCLLKAAIAVFGLPLSTMCMCASFGAVGILLPASGAEGGPLALAVCLVPGDAILGVDLLAALLQLFEAPGLARIVRGREHDLFLL